MEPAFPPLPRETDHEGRRRKTGVELEFSGLDIDETARIAAEALDGHAVQTADREWEVRGSSIGILEIYLDTALRHAEPSRLRDIGLDLGKEVIPVEIVSEPLTFEGLADIDRLRVALREAGAEGTRAGLAYGFGLHLNPALAGTEAKHIAHPLYAYALIEDWMRDNRPIDPSRRLLPFTDPYPTKLLQAFCDEGFVTPERAMDIYLDKAPSRNYGLDMLPIFAWLDADAVDRATGGESAVKGRPAFHFRLPDCQIDNPEWSIRQEWGRWRMVEQVAEDEGLLARLMKEWDDAHHRVTLRRRPWAERCGDILAEAGLLKDEAAA
ncbi:amidoligase family protein [Pseudooceanicola sp. C21-150M6]|uniref:amidoligase family protein n=1 Tax=Pseudooceanicola sp. C21-150M6 TaxID=3434355 RepID=UPI003D7FC81E